MTIARTVARRVYAEPAAAVDRWLARPDDAPVHGALTVGHLRRAVMDAAGNLRDGWQTHVPPEARVVEIVVYPAALGPGAREIAGQTRDAFNAAGTRMHIPARMCTIHLPWPMLQQDERGNDYYERAWRIGRAAQQMIYAGTPMRAAMGAVRVISKWRRGWDAQDVLRIARDVADQQHNGRQGMLKMLAARKAVADAPGGPELDAERLRQAEREFYDDPFAIADVVHVDDYGHRVYFMSADGRSNDLFVRFSNDNT